MPTGDIGDSSDISGPWRLQRVGWEEFYGRNIVLENTQGVNAVIGGQLQVVVIDEFDPDQLRPEREELMLQIAERLERVLNEEFA